VIGERDIVFHRAAPAADGPCGRHARIAVSDGRRQGPFQGLRWPIDGLDFHPAHRIGTSNTATGGMVEIETDDRVSWSSCRARTGRGGRRLVGVCGKPVDCLALALPVRLR
jgi:hypothetical protein